MLKYEMTKKDYVNAMYFSFKESKDLKSLKTLLLTIGVGVVLFLLLGLGLLLLFDHKLILTPTLLKPLILISIVIIALIVFSNERFNALWLANKRLKSGSIEKQYFGRHILELGERSFKVQCGNICSVRSYAGIERIMNYPSSILIYTSQVEMIIIPEAAFERTEQRTDFINYLRSKSEKAKNSSIEEQELQELQESQAEYILKNSWEESDFINAAAKSLRLLYRTKQGWTIGQIISLMFSVIIFIRGITALVEPEFKMIGLILILFAVMLQIKLISAFITPLSKYIIASCIASGSISRNHFEKQTLYIRHEHLAILRKYSYDEMSYDRLFCVKQDKNNLYILLKGESGIIIPNTAFQSDDEKQDIVRFISARINNESLTA